MKSKVNNLRLYHLQGHPMSFKALVEKAEGFIVKPYCCGCDVYVTGGSQKIDVVNNNFLVVYNDEGGNLVCKGQAIKQVVKLVESTVVRLGEVMRQINEVNQLT